MLPAKDFVGNPRIAGSQIDIGAYEYQADGVQEDDSIPAVQEFRCFPNPFNPQIQFQIVVPKSDNSEYAMRIYNLKGQLVQVLTMDTNQKAGLCSVVWNGENASSGIYFARLVKNNLPIQTKKITLIK